MDERAKRMTWAIVGGIVLTLGITPMVACSGATTNDIGANDGGNDGATNEGGGSNAYTLDNVCDLTTPKICASDKVCCSSLPSGFDQAGCEAHSKEQCAKNVAEVRAGTMTFDGTKVDACLAKIQPYIEKCSLTFDDLNKLAGDFNGCHVFEGKLGEGAACDRDDQCAPATSAKEFTGCDAKTKTCTRSRFLSSGDACKIGDNVHEFCGTGTYCDANATTLAGMCKPSTPLGQACDAAKQFNLECGLGYYCDSQTAKCSMTKPGGATCATGLECASFTCTTQKCTTPDPLVKPEECTGKTDGG